MATPFTNVGGDPNQAAKDNYNFSLAATNSGRVCIWNAGTEMGDSEDGNAAESQRRKSFLHGDCIGEAAQLLHWRIRCTRVAGNSTTAGHRQESHDECKHWLCWFAQCQS